jgi:uncharacterized protein DUF3810
MSRNPPRGGGLLALTMAIVAIAATLVPLPADVVERYFSQGVYPPLQRTVTGVSNLSPIAIADLVVATLLGVLFARFVRGWRTQGMKKALVGSVVTVVALAAIGQLVFLAVWGLHYRRLPLEQKLDFDQSRITEANAFALSEESVRRVNLLYGPAHATPFDMLAVASAFAEAERAMGMPGTTRIGRPKRSLLELYVEKAAFSGVVEPVFLEIVLHPDLLPVQKPRVLAHEWAHLAGFADESEASFLAWLACLRGDPLAQYSGWLSTFALARVALPPRLAATLPRLDPGPRHDLQAIAAVYRGSSPLVSQAARRTYDSYLKANRVSEGMASYDAVLKLMLGTTLGSSWR